jgi:glyoxylase-like metal-dependent hydrolase (beta-lactamase superfamily II)
MKAHSKQLDSDIMQVDTGYQREGLAACYLVVDNGCVAVIDTGVEHTVPRIYDALAAIGLTFENVEYVVPTHVHLDHAGGAGKLMQACPGARMVIHPYGSRHMIDPARLIAGAEAVYGKAELRRSVGEIVSVDASRVIEADDMFRFSVGERELMVIDTPGHARHHFCIWDEQSRGIFSGDTLGIVYPELDCNGLGFIFPPTTPVQFDPPAWHASIDRLMALHPERAYLTHFGMLQDPALYMESMHRRIDDLAATALAHENAVDKLEQAVTAYILAELERTGCTYDRGKVMQILQMDIGIVAQGLLVWLERSRALN